MFEQIDVYAKEVMPIIFEAVICFRDLKIVTPSTHQFALIMTQDFHFWNIKHLSLVYSSHGTHNCLSLKVKFLTISEEGERKSSKKFDFHVHFGLYFSLNLPYKKFNSFPHSNWNCMTC